MRQPIVSVVVDLQNDYLDPRGGLARGGLDHRPLLAVVPAANAVNRIVRRAGGRVVFLRSIYTDRHGGWLQPAMQRHGARRWAGMGDDFPFVRDGDWGSELHPELEVGDEDTVVVKRHFDGFFSSELGRVLEAASAATLIFSGVTTDICVMFTAQEAFQRGHDVIVVKDAVAAYEAHRQVAALDVLDRAIGRTVDSDELAAELQTREISV